LMEVGLAWREDESEPAVAAFVAHAKAAYNI
jgi:hypothetical protein